MSIKKDVTAIIADDVFEMRTLLSKVLEGLECSVLAKVNNGVEAVEMVERLKPDIVFLDIDMPDMTGLEVLDILKSKESDVFRVIVSGRNTIDNVTQALAHGANGFVVKPYSASKIKQIIDKYYAQFNKE